MQHSNQYSPNRVFRSFAKLMYRFSGWTIKGSLPENPKYLIAIAHHTSNWDFIILIFAKTILCLRMHFLAKHSLFTPPLGWLMRKLGGVPVRRQKAHDMVSQVVNIFQENNNFVLALTPEGTRGPVTHWKMGFYHIAQKANVPVVPIALNYQSRKVVIGEAVMLTGDEHNDMRTLHSFFLPHPPKYPENAWYGPFDNRD